MCVQVIFLMRFVVVGMTGVPFLDVSARLPLGAGLWFLAVTAVYLYNGTTDVQEDRVNGSGRPIARGVLSVRAARRSAAVLAVSALAGGALMSLPVCAAVAALLLLGYAYSAPGISLKSHTPGTGITVIASGALTYVTGVLCGEATVSPALIAFCAAMCLWMGLVGAVVKDFSDTAGDARHGRRNWTVRWGRTVTAHIASVCAVSIGAALTVCALVLDAPELLAPCGVLLVGAVALSAASLTGRPADSRRRRRLPYRIFMGTQYAAHVAAVAQPIA